MALKNVPLFLYLCLYKWESKEAKTGFPVQRNTLWMRMEKKIWGKTMMHISLPL